VEEKNLEARPNDRLSWASLGSLDLLHSMVGDVNVHGWSGGATSGRLFQALHR